MMESAMKDIAAESAETDLLLGHVRAGDERAFERLFAQHRAALRRFVALRLDSRLRQRVDPSDVVQETQLEAFQRLPDFLARKPMPFRLWLWKTAYERLLKIRRQHVGTARRSTAREIPLPDRSSLLIAQQLQAAGSSPSQHLARRELVQRVRQAVAQLAEMDREVLFLRFFEGQSYQEVSCVLGVEPATARKRFGRALLHLQKLLFATGLPESER
jgi:RNA polymerase sigma-70 factor (ECF subfamily)